MRRNMAKSLIVCVVLLSIIFLGCSISNAEVNSNITFIESVKNSYLFECPKSSGFDTIGNTLEDFFPEGKWTTSTVMGIGTLVLFTTPCTWDNLRANMTLVIQKSDPYTYVNSPGDMLIVGFQVNGEYSENRVLINQIIKTIYAIN